MTEPSRGLLSPLHPFPRTWEVVAPDRQRTPFFKCPEMQCEDSGVFNGTNMLSRLSSEAGGHGPFWRGLCAAAEWCRWTGELRGWTVRECPEAMNVTLS